MKLMTWLKKLFKRKEPKVNPFKGFKYPIIKK